jgi:hypothetical protein
MEAETMTAIVRVDGNGRQVGQVHVCHAERPRPLCGADAKHPDGWQTDFAAEPTCKRCLKAQKETTPLFLEVR